VHLPARSKADGLRHSLAYLMTVDNSGPQSADEIIAAWANTRALFPSEHMDIHIHLPIYLSIYPSIYPSICLYQSIYPDTWANTHARPVPE
jgi:hypothetical protein